MTWLKKVMLGVAVVVAGFIGFLFIAVNSSSEIKRESHIARVDWLPSAASDITYSQRTGFGWFLTYECNLPEAEFRSLAEKEKWPIQEATNVRVSGLRSTLNLPALTNAFGDPTYIERAFLFERRQPNNGGTTVLYDRERSRLFVSKSHR
jgi:hypothetical protein